MHSTNLRENLAENGFATTTQRFDSDVLPSKSKAFQWGAQPAPGTAIEQHANTPIDTGELEAVPSVMPGLTEGRIVHYVAYNKRCLAGMIIGKGEKYGSADLVVYTNMSNVNGVKNFGQQFHQDVPYSETKEPGTYHWPERA